MIKTKLFPLAYKEDIVLSIETIKAIGATRIWDIGCGNGAWAIKVNESVPVVTFELLDNFKFVEEQKIKLLPYWWPKDEKELLEHLNMNEIDFTFHNQDIQHLPDIESDFIRLDTARETQDTIAWCLFNLSDTGVINCCDIKTNKSFDKLMMMQTEVIKGNLELVWLGEAEGVWCRPGRGEELREKLLDNQDLHNYFGYFDECSYELMGTEYKYVRAKLNQSITSQNKGLLNV